MKHHKLPTLVQAILIAMSTMLILAAPVSAHPYTDPSWNTAEQGYLTQAQGTSYAHYVPVCLEASVYGPYWDTVNHPNHARIVNALGSWNNVGGELYYYTSNIDCATRRAGGISFLSIGKSNISPLANTSTTSGTVCNEPWGVWCSKEIHIEYDSVPTYSWYVDTGTPPNNTYDFWSTMLHEIGHSMFCNNHSTNSADAMYGILGHNGDYQRVLSAADKLCYSHYYGTTH